MCTYITTENGGNRAAGYEGEVKSIDYVSTELNKLDEFCKVNTSQMSPGIKSRLVGWWTANQTTTRDTH
jgi:hypothetical protein